MVASVPSAKHAVLNGMIDAALNMAFNSLMNQAVQSAVEMAAGQTELARLVGARQQEVWNWLNGRPVPERRCPKIERATGGQVLCETLRPDVRWVRVPDACWPHPSGRPCIDVAADTPVVAPDAESAKWPAGAAHRAAQPLVLAAGVRHDA
jgi:DNA-binding transcriptional regulator YdaS (Cro superfamily)